MKHEPCDLFTKIPREKLNFLFENSDADVELDYTFLGFEEIYQEVYNYAPKDMTIIDLGCGYACQSWYFREHNSYIGVDYFCDDNSVIHTENSKYYFTSIQNFIKNIFPGLGLDLKKCFAVCSYVPDSEARNLVKEVFSYCKIYYPGEISYLAKPDEKKALDIIISTAEKKTGLMGSKKSYVKEFSRD